MGGAINTLTASTIANSVFESNSASPATTAANGGALLVFSLSTYQTIVSNCTFKGNSAVEVRLMLPSFLSPTFHPRRH